MKDYRHNLRYQNRKKNGRPFILPGKIIEIIAGIRAVFNASFRSLDSYLRLFEEIRGCLKLQRKSGTLSDTKRINSLLSTLATFYSGPLACIYVWYWNIFNRTQINRDFSFTDNKCKRIREVFALSPVSSIPKAKET
jgi:hypothetical protein